jgi:hypothetical protein
MFKYNKLNDKKQVKLKKSTILNPYNFSLSIKILIYMNIININKCGIKTI